MDFKPFADDSASVEMSGLTFENNIDYVSIYGQTTISKDSDGLQHARLLQTHINKIIEALQNNDLSIKSEIKPTVMVKNPFL